MRQAFPPNEGFDSFAPNPSSTVLVSRMFSIGNRQLTELLRFIEVIDQARLRAYRKFSTNPAWDNVATAIDTFTFQSWIGFQPSASIVFGI